MPPRPRKQLLLKLGVFLLLGAIVNVAVAWGLTQTAPIPVCRMPPLPDQLTLLPPTGPIVDPSSREWKWVSASGLSPTASLPLRIAEEQSMRGFRERRLAAIPHDADYGPCITVYEAGWPLLSFEGARYFDQAMRTQVFALVYVARAQPVKPLWPGFAINTTCYAVIVWLLFLIAGKIRRDIVSRDRLARHCCPTCGYKIDSAPGIGPRCSECGAALPRQFADAAQQHKT